MAYNHPKLLIPDEAGKYAAEYIPSITTNWEILINNLRRRLFNLLGWNEYWWHVRSFYGPSYQKVYDLDFIRHVEEVHNSVPENRWERYHYDYIQTIYAGEYAWVKEELTRGVAATPDNDILDTHPYAHAYNNFWLNVNISPEWRALYHGVPAYEALDIVCEDMRSRGLISPSNESPFTTKDADVI